MNQGQDIDIRLRQSVLRLRAWRWMSLISNDPEQVALLLTAEARALIDIGRDHPARAKDIGKLIVAYHKMIVCMRQSAGKENVAA